MRTKSSSCIEVSAVWPVITFALTIAVSTAPEAIVSAPPAATVASPLTSAKTASLTTLKSALFSVPASEIISSSVSATSPVISVWPEIVLLLSIEPSTALAAIVNAPESEAVASPLIEE